jgi:hypothetical protein
MNIHDACEEAYKRGYERGVKEFAEKLLNNYVIRTHIGDVVFDTDIYNIANDMEVEK